MSRLPSQKKFAISRPRVGGPSKRSATAPGGSTTQKVPVSEASQPPPSSTLQLDATLVPPGVSQLIDSRLLDPGSSTQSTSGPSQTATQVDASTQLPKSSLARASRSPELAKRNPPPIEAIDARLLDNAPLPTSTSVPLPRPTKPTTRGTTSPEIAKRPLASSAPLETPILPPPPSTRPKAKVSLVHAAKTTDENVVIPYHRGKRAGSRASSRAGSRAPSQSPAPSLVDIEPAQIDPALSPTIGHQPAPSSPVREKLAIQSVPPPSPRTVPTRKDNAGLPPSLGGTSTPPTIGEGSTSGMPPTLGTSQGPASPNATLASASATADPSSQVEDSHTSHAPRIRGRKAAGTVSKPPRRPRKAPPAPVAEVPADGMEVDVQPEAGPSARPATASTAPTRPARQATKRKRPVRPDTPVSRADTESLGDAAEEADGEYEGTPAPGGSLEGMTRKVKCAIFVLPSRDTLTCRTKKKMKLSVSYATGEAQPGEMLGAEIDPDTATMKDLVTDLGGEGRVSERGLTLAPLVRERYLERRRTREEENKGVWEQRQVMRRQARAMRNANKERLREEARAKGEDSEGIAKDSEDTDEDFEHVPERLTPESSPEPGGAREQDHELEEGEGENGEEGEEDREDPLFLPEEEDEEQMEEDEADAALRRAGFTVRPDDAPREDNDDEEAPDFDPEQMSFDEYQAVMERYEANRRRGLENAQNREVVEEDRVQMVNNASFSRKKKVRNEKWTDEETDFFYHVLGEVGENYGLMAHYFPGRSMNQVKRKGVRENKADPARVTAAIYSKKRMDVTYLRKTVGYDSEAPMDKERSFIQEVIAESERMKKEDSEVSIRLQEIANGQEEEGEDEAEVEGEIGDEEDEVEAEVPELEV